MLSKEEIEKDNTFKISIPMIIDDELRNIDNNFESIVKEFTKSYVKEKDLLIAQHIMKKQQDKIDKLESDKQKLVEQLKTVKQKVVEEDDIDIQSMREMTLDEVEDVTYFVNDLIRAVKQLERKINNK